MKGKFLFASALSVLITTGAFFTSCDDDDDNNNSSETKTISFENVTTVKDFVQSGTFQKTGSSPLILPGEQIQIKFSAGKGQALSFVTMYGNSKDLFFAPVNPGIMLYDANGNAITGDVSAQVKLWDNGTIINSDPALTASDQTTGTEDKNITEIAGNDGTYNYPAASEMMKLSLTYDTNKSEFTLTILNNTNRTNVQTPFSPGVWAVSNMLGGNLENEAPFYKPAHKTTTELTAIATMGNNQPFSNMLSANTGIITGISPVLVVVYRGDTNPIFQVNQKDGGIGLKNLAQTGDASVLKNSLINESNVRNVYVLGTSAIAPGSKVEGSFEADSNDKIAFATMFGYSNDWFYANNSSMDALSTGDKTTQVSLYDNGTAVSQYPGAGNAQAVFANRPIVEDQVIKAVDKQTYPNLPEVNQILKVTIK